MNPLSDIAFFVELAQSRNLSAAAQALGVTTAAVSRRLSALETRLGIRLLNRTTRALAATEVGRSYYQRIRGILDDLETLDDEVRLRGTTPRGRLRITSSVSFGREFVAPVVA